MSKSTILSREDFKTKIPFMDLMPDDEDVSTRKVEVVGNLSSLMADLFKNDYLEEYKEEDNSNK